jgi:putative transposase
MIPKAKIWFEIVRKLSRMYNPRLLCILLKVSLSGYYKFLKRNGDREEKDVDLIRELSMKTKRKYGYRTMTMKLTQRGVHMNHKKVLRIMSKYDLLAKIRRKNPYKMIMKKTQEHKTAPNILGREFHGITPFRKIGTDITYLHFQGKWIYLSIVKDMITSEILSFGVSDSLAMTIIQITFSRLEGRRKLKWAIFHSDQWFHYTHPYFQSQLRKLGCVQSMSRKGNCIDNAPTESFFGHLKDEIDLSGCETIGEVEKYLKNYIFYFNNHRPQWSRKKMTPIEYRNHLLLLQP